MQGSLKCFLNEVWVLYLCYSWSVLVTRYCWKVEAWRKPSPQPSQLWMNPKPAALPCSADSSLIATRMSAKAARVRPKILRSGISSLHCIWNSFWNRFIRQSWFVDFTTAVQLQCRWFSNFNFKDHYSVTNTLSDVLKVWSTSAERSPESRSRERPRRRCTAIWRHCSKNTEVDVLLRV